MIRLIPRETKFFRMFAEVSQNVTEGARLLQDILKNPANMATSASIDCRRSSIAAMR